MNGLPIFEHQVAGRHSSSTSNLLRGQYGRVLKPYKVKRLSQDPSTHANKETNNIENKNFSRQGVVCEDEHQFYELCRQQGQEWAALRELMPAYFGETLVHTDGVPTRYVELEDLTCSCAVPCVADLKMGTSVDYPGKYARKLCPEKVKYPSLKEIGWCIAGLRKSSPGGELLHKFGPETGRELSTEQVHRELEEFFWGDKGSEKRRVLITRIISALEEILRWFNTQRKFWFRSSSILVIYNAEYFCDPYSERIVEEPALKLDEQNSERPPVKSCTGNVGEMEIFPERIKTINDSSSSQDIVEVSGQRTVIKDQNSEINSPSQKDLSSICQRSDKDAGFASLQRKECDDDQLILRVKMIDFAHVLDAAGEPDHGYILGLNNLIEFMKKLY
ncbi:inositol polyphosphate multikinase [Hyalella azteca]|uniref:Kinase n=1 Tax=Hyalella azteca TaxID=294128 RepID=A0A8B7NQ02_HYAAZ|nr:inositol polyphosphate multikinase [Hyalella azteca]